MKVDAFKLIALHCNYCLAQNVKLKKLNYFFLIFLILHQINSKYYLLL
jgi:hypothetical protein